MLLETNS